MSFYSAQDPSDNVFVHLDGGENHTYQYLIEDDHPAGTYWYHAHLHGSTMFQVYFAFIYFKA